MNGRVRTEAEYEELSTRLLDVLIRAGLILIMVVLCYRIFSPFISMMAWAVILAVAIYPLHQSLARRIGAKQGLAATLIAVLGAVVIVVPTALLLSSLGDSVRELVQGAQNNTLQVPEPRPGVADWPLVGDRIYGVWSRASSDLPALVQSMQPKIGELARSALRFVAGIGGQILLFLASFIIAGIIMAFGQEGSRSSEAIFARLFGPRAGEFIKLCTSTIRAVAQGVIGIALIQAIAIGLILLIAGVPLAGGLAVIALVMGIAQIPLLLIVVPVIAYLWMSGNYGTGAAIVYSIVLLLAGIADNFLKPLLLGRGVDAPMPVILLGALGGMASNGIIGLFIGATLLALGYQLFMSWVARRPGDSAVNTAG
ncbi:MAG TPA: AI-2E family transporter [Candidatus Polarisedimenticolia bacterium]|nr:AI-2E family transporter [Candidatus Polarisedimenticolia bacterium]